MAPDFDPKDDKVQTAVWAGEGLRVNQEVNIGIAIGVNDGVVVAVIHNAKELGLEEIAVQRRGVAERARAGRLRPSDIAAATFC